MFLLPSTSPFADDIGSPTHPHPACTMRRDLYRGKLLTWPVTLGIALVFTGAAAGQDKKAKPDLAPGYKKLKIEGFTVFVSDESHGHLDDPAYKLTPRQALQLELKTITDLFKTHSVKLLRGVLIWVEWNHVLRQQDGKPPPSLEAM